MCKQLCLFLLLVALAYAGHVSAKCVLNKEYVLHSLGTFAKHHKDQIYPYMSHSIEDGDFVEVYCHKDGNKFEKHNVTCKGGQLYPKDPIKCATLSEATVIPSPKRDPFCPAKMYRVGIQIEKEFLEYYRICYDKENFRTYFSDSKIYSKSIHFKIPFRRFTTDGLINAEQVASFDFRNVFKAFSKIFGDNQTYIKKIDDFINEIVIETALLTFPGRMKFPDQIISTYKYVNVVPLFTSIYLGNCNHIESWINNNIRPNTVWEVRSGGLGILSLLDFKATRTLKPVYLIPEKKQNALPEWMYKIVSGRKQAFVFLTYNNIFNPKKPAAHKCCKTIKCPLTLLKSEGNGFTYCCEPEAFVKCLSKVE